MENNSLEKIYRFHHSTKRGVDFVLLGEERGQFLSNHIGTGHKVLDIGCRDGELTSYYAKGNIILGADIDSVALNRAAEKLKISVINMDLNGDWKELGDSKYEFVVACEIIEHLYFPENVISKIVSKLSDGGTLVGTVPNAFNLKNRIRLLMGKKKNTPLNDPTHINHFTRDELFSLLSKYFNSVEIYPLGSYSKLDWIWPGMLSFGFMFVAKDIKIN